MTELPQGDSMVALAAAPAYAVTTWGPYFNAMTGAPRRVHWYASWKNNQLGADRAAALWRQREALRVAYEQLHGDDLDRWPDAHPGVVLNGTDFFAYSACLRCQWLHAERFDVRDPAQVVIARQRAREHQEAPIADVVQDAPRF